MQYKTFNTGDQVWYSKRYGQDVVVKLITSDGLTWEEGDAKPLTKLTGAEKFLHRIVVAAIRFSHSIMKM